MVDPEGCVRAWDEQVEFLESEGGVFGSLMVRALRGWGEGGIAWGLWVEGVMQ